jgi:hypothetical protein
MAPINEGVGFGSNPQNLLTTNADYIFREIQAGSFGTTITSIFPEVDPGSFIRSAGDATANGGLIIVGRLAILQSKSGQIPPGPDVTTGFTPGTFRSKNPNGFTCLWQETIFTWPQNRPTRFLPGEMEATEPDSSLYVVFGGLRQILAGTIAVVGAIADASAAFAILSVLGKTYTQPSNTSLSSGGLRSIPRYANG